MSVATEFAPAVPIPPPVRTARHLRAVSPAVNPDRVIVPTAPARGGRSAAAIALLRPPGRVSPVAPVRLTRRGVLALSLLVAALSIVLVWTAARSAGDATPTASASARGPATVTVRAGDTLWSIAGRVAPERDSRAEVSSLQRLNHLRGVELVPGQRLHVR